MTLSLWSCCIRFAGSTALARHCEERSDEAIHLGVVGNGLLRSARNDVKGPLFLALALLALVGAEALVYAQGHPLICKCGYVKFWHGIPNSSENSQHIADWYTFSHIIHGFLFYGAAKLIGRLVGRDIPFAAALLAAVVVEGAWEVLENSPVIIER